ncbi:DNA-binding domain-containing protein [Paraburkholderia sp. CNPSo 3274]|uniref:HvfC/BufC N-terminal domain-containing protein n=1 Tax=Paraburkholderia sp. CNPSo 3274 TaxID=2940932 RepID=UPI0020B8EC6B|nr:DNA-binding domain-containing protein [Paraburkholderia sp. CNPSo 3274]MCP3712151.1 DNA-binding domain-containing protein [Paraburkholderia sp. CNPSo 3274]
MKPEQHTSDYATAFAPGLTNPELATPNGVVAAHGKGVVKRYNVYRNNVTVSLIDALAAIYPAVQRITGVEFFRAMARFHVRATPPASPLLFEYGRDFPSFIETWEYARDMPWLADTARIERAWLDAYHAEDAAPLAAGAFASIALDSLAHLRFAPHPAARIVRSRYPAVAIFAMNRAPGPVTPLHSNEAEDALVTRPEYDVIVSRLPAGGAAFLLALIEGMPLGAAAQAAFEESDTFDLPASLAAMISAGVFAAVQLGA